MVKLLLLLASSGFISLDSYSSSRFFPHSTPSCALLATQCPRRLCPSHLTILTVSRHFRYITITLSFLDKSCKDWLCKTLVITYPWWVSQSQGGQWSRCSSLTQWENFCLTFPWALYSIGHIHALSSSITGVWWLLSSYQTVLLAGLNHLEQQEHPWARIITTNHILLHYLRFLSVHFSGSPTPESTSPLQAFLLATSVPAI